MRVYKYRGGSDETLVRDLGSLANDQIYLASLDQLNDPFEARVKYNEFSYDYANFVTAIMGIKDKEVHNKAAWQFFSLIHGVIKGTKEWGIYSLSKSYRDELLWAYYAEAHSGFCIEYDLHELMSYSLQQDYYVEVAYESEIPRIGFSDLVNGKPSKRFIQKAVGTKSNRWKHEDEVRIVAGSSGLRNIDYRAVKAVYFGYRSSDNLRQLVMHKLMGRGLNYYLMKPVKGSYHLEREPLDDPCKTNGKYKDCQAIVEKGVPFIDDVTAPYEDEVKRAIEKARREPYCEKVIEVYLSDKGTPEAPVFFVTYERSDDLLKKFHYGISELRGKGEETI